MSEYVENALKFMQKNGVKMSIKYVDYVYNPWNEEKWARWHNKYKVIIKRNNKQMTVNFYDSAYNTENGLKPTEYDILACLQKYEVYDFNSFCYDYGYNVDSRKDYETYLKVKREYNNVVRVFGDIIEELQEIQ